jgi:hypothetical protein
MRLEGTKKWVAGHPAGFETLIEALSEDGGGLTPALPGEVSKVNREN